MFLLSFSATCCCAVTEKLFRVFENILVLQYLIDSNCIMVLKQTLESIITVQTWRYPYFLFVVSPALTTSVGQTFLYQSTRDRKLSFASGSTWAGQSGEQWGAWQNYNSRFVSWKVQEILRNAIATVLLTYWLLLQSISAKLDRSFNIVEFMGLLRSVTTFSCLSHEVIWTTETSEIE